MVGKQFLRQVSGVMMAAGLMFAAVVVTSSVASARSSSGLQQYIIDNGFRPFAQPRMSDGLGSIIRFNRDDQEILVASPDQDHCVDLSLVNHTNPGQPQSGILLSERSYGRDQGGEFEFSLGKLFASRLNIGASLNANVASTVTVKLVDPFRVRISESSANTFYDGLSETSPCKKSMSARSSMIILSVVGCRGIEYSFQDNNHKNVSITAEFLRSVGLDPAFNSSAIGRESIRFVAPAGQYIYLGYIPWTPKRAFGVTTSSRGLRQLKPEEIDALRQEAKKQ